MPIDHMIQTNFQGEKRRGNFTSDYIMVDLLYPQVDHMGEIINKPAYTRTQMVTTVSDTEVFLAGLIPNPNPRGGGPWPPDTCQINKHWSSPVTPGDEKTYILHDIREKIEEFNIYRINDGKLIFILEAELNGLNYLILQLGRPSGAKDIIQANEKIRFEIKFKVGT